MSRVATSLPADAAGDTVGTVGIDEGHAVVAAVGFDAGEPADLRRLLAEAKGGDSSAFARLVEVAGADLIRVVRRQLPRRLRRLCDSQDFLQAVWATFLIDPAAPEAFTSSEHLLAYLRRVAANKVTDEVRRRIVAKKGTIDRDVAIDHAGGEIPARGDETPSKIAIAREQMEVLVKGQPDHYRRLLELKAGGATTAEAAAAIGLNEGSARRVLAKLSRRIGAT